MNDPTDTARTAKTSIAPMLSVRDGAKAVEFYKAAFGAAELFRLDSEDGAVVARLAVSEAEFWVADESPEHLNFSPESLGGGSVRMVMVVEDPDAAFPCTRGGSHRGFARCEPVWLALRTNRRSLRTSLGNRQASPRVAPASIPAQSSLAATARLMPAMTRGRPQPP